jgi:hypothetical protein
MSRKADGYFVILDCYLCPTEYGSKITADSARYGGRECLEDKLSLLPIILFGCICSLRKVFVPDPIISAMLLCSGLDNPRGLLLTFMPSPSLSDLSVPLTRLASFADYIATS